MKTSILLAVALALTSPVAFGKWKLSKVIHMPQTNTCYDPGFHSQSGARVDSQGKSVWGAGFAREFSVPGDAFCSAVAVGIHLEWWRHEPQGIHDKVGEIEIDAFAEIHGEARLLNADCAAAALGFMELRVERDGVPFEVRADLTQSVAATTREQVASLSGGWTNGQDGGVSFSGSIDLTVGVGEGRYPDFDIDVLLPKNWCPVKTLGILRKSRGTIYCWADEFWGYEASAEADLGGIIVTNVLKLDWPECPE